MSRVLLVGAVLTLAVAGCGEDTPMEPEGSGPVTVEINQGPVTLDALGSSTQLTATVKDGAGNVVEQPLTWSALGQGVVSVTAAGLVTATGNGSETVSVATMGSNGASLEVTVSQVSVSLDLTAPVTQFSIVGQTTTLVPVALDANDNPVTSASSFTFESANPATIFVDGQGTVTANGSGAVDVSASSGGLTATLNFRTTFSGPQGTAILGGTIPCSGGMAVAFPCDRIDLVSYLPMSGLGGDIAAGDLLNDMWGWIDPATSKEYALVGLTDGVSFVDLSDPESPRALGFLAAAAAPTSWRDIKVFQNHAYIVADASPGHGIQIFDLTRLRNVSLFTTFSEDGRYTAVGSVHNLVVNEEAGFAFAVGSGGAGNTCGGGLHMLDLANPGMPTFAGCYSDPSIGRQLTGYTHDAHCVVYAGPDPDHAGREICFGANETAVSIVDVTNKGAPIGISTATYPDVQYAHQGWLSQDHRYFFQNDELDELFGIVANTRLLVWDVIDLDDPILVTQYSGPTGAIDHNMYVVGDFLYHSNYHFGLRVVDVSTPTAPAEAGFFDTHPVDDASGFSGSWSNYPFFSSGIVAVTSAEEGLFILRRQP